MTEIDAQTPDRAGRLTAFGAYACYLLSIPSAALFAPVGVIIAYAGRSTAGPLARTHIDAQIKLFWWAFWWGVGLAIACGISLLLTVVLVGFPLLLIIGVIGFIVMVWFTIKSGLGLLALLDNRAAT